MEYIHDSLQTTEKVKKFFEEDLPARFSNERVRLYLAMRRHFTANFGYADQDTCDLFYAQLYDEVEKMRVYRDSAENDLFLPGGREILASKLEMAKLHAFHDHLSQKVKELSDDIRGKSVWRIAFLQGVFAAARRLFERGQ